jgi:hypothetical protein
MKITIKTNHAAAQVELDDSKMIIHQDMLQILDSLYRKVTNLTKLELKNELDLSNAVYDSSSTLTTPVTKNLNKHFNIQTGESHATKNT